MDKKITSYNTRVSSDIKQRLFPSWPQIILDFIIGVLLLVVLNSRGLWSYFATGSASDTKINLGSLISERFPAAQSLSDTLSQGRVIQILFWLFVGCIVYIFVWFAGSFLTNIRNDIVADEYLHPYAYNRSRYWSSVFSRKGLFAAMAVIFVAYLYTALKLVALLGILSYQSVVDFQWLSLAILAGALVATALLVQVCLLLLRFVINSWKLIYKDL